MISFNRSALITLGMLFATNALGDSSVSCLRDLSHGVIVMFSGGPVDEMNPIEVRNRMDESLQNIESNSLIQGCTDGADLAFRFSGQEGPATHVHQSKWKEVCSELGTREQVSPVVIVGHSNGGAAAVSLARCLKAQNKIVDLLVTADTVLTGNDMGPVDQVPSNVKFNINTYLNPNFVTWLGPFPFGHANSLEGKENSARVINAGLGYLLPAMVAHRNAFYDFAGGDKLENQTFSKPTTLMDLTLALLQGESQEALSEIAFRGLQGLSSAANIEIEVKSDSVKTKFKPR